VKYKPIIIVAGEPNSIFLEILFKTIKLKKFKSPLILIASKKIVLLQMKALKYKLNINLLEFNGQILTKLNKKKINLINVDFNQTKAFNKISLKSRKYIEKSFNIALSLIKLNLSDKLINGPISKKYFLKKKFFGVTEYLGEKTNSKNIAMLIYNKFLSVSPLTTHIPIKSVAKKITKKDIINKILLLNKFYKKNFKLTPKIAVTGLNPHCESRSLFDEDKQIIKPSINMLKKKNLLIEGPFSADTIFLKKNRNRFNLIIGMYHDQVLTPLKTIYEYDAINITVGLPFIRVSPDHGPNEKMMGKNLSNPLSLIRSLEFLDNR